MVTMNHLSVEDPEDPEDASLLLLLPEAEDMATPTPVCSLRHAEPKEFFLSRFVLCRPLVYIFTQRGCSEAPLLVFPSAVRAGVPTSPSACCCCSEATQLF